jgi:hypothetical protein
MGMDTLVTQNIFTKGILALLRDNSGRSYTMRELIETQHLFDSIPQATKSIELLVKQGLVKVKIRGRDLCYQVMPPEKK